MDLQLRPSRYSATLRQDSHDARARNRNAALRADLVARDATASKTPDACQDATLATYLTDPVEVRVFQFYIWHAGCWLDIVSPGRHMSKTVAMMALRDGILRSACLAFGSRALFLASDLDKLVEERYSESALTLLIGALSSAPQTWQESSMLATIVLLRMSEQFSELNDDQQHHLKGASGISTSICRRCATDSLGLEGTAFWTYVRMSIRVSFLYEKGTQCNLALMRDSFDPAVVHDAAWTNRITKLLAEVCSVCWDADATTATSLDSLIKQLDVWRVHLPDSFQPWAVVTSDESVFPCLKFLETWHTVAWQFYYAAKALSAVFSMPTIARHGLLSLNRYMQSEILDPIVHLCGVTINCDAVGTEMNGSHLVAWCGQYLTQRSQQDALVDWLHSSMSRSKWPNRTVISRLQRIWDGQQSSWTGR